MVIANNFAWCPTCRTNRHMVEVRIDLARNRQEIQQQCTSCRRATDVRVVTKEVK